MRKYLYTAICGLVMLGSSSVAQQAVNQGSDAPWSLNGTIIEACSCPMFCQCYFNPHPAEHTDQGQHKGHGKGQYCRFNNAVKVNSGHHGGVKLDGAKFWVA